MSASSHSLKDRAILLASHNKGKLEELHDLLGGKVATLSSALDYNLSEPEETETTFIGNAELKALDSLNQMKKLGHDDVVCIADDSGFSVDALNGAPGVYSARWAERDGHEGRDFIHAMTRVYEEWQKTAPHNDQASFISVIAVAFPDGHVEVFEGEIKGKITWPARGSKGFGYDPIFTPEGETRTFAEMSFAEKQTLSHRAIALKKMMDALL